jgi:hypothetical protein
MIEALLQGADMPPREVEGVSEEFCASMIFPLAHLSMQKITNMEMCQPSIASPAHPSKNPSHALYAAIHS